MGVPLRGSWAVLFIVSSLFLGSSLGLGLLLSTVTRNQFVAAQGALTAAFLPATMLSGFVFEIDSMPLPVQAATYLVPGPLFRRRAADAVPGRGYLAGAAGADRFSVAVGVFLARPDRVEIRPPAGWNQEHTHVVCPIDLDPKELQALFSNPQSRRHADHAGHLCSWCCFPSPPRWR